MKQFFIALDQVINTLLFWLPGGVWADETLSSRAWRCRDTRAFGWLRRLIDVVFFWDAEHCRKSYESERLRMQSPPELR